MNRLLSLSLVPLAATATVASIAFTPDSAQALSLSGQLNLSGDYIFNSNGAIGGNDDTATIQNMLVNASTGSFAPLEGFELNPLNLEISLTDIGSNSLGATSANSQAYTATIDPNMINFGAFSFTVDNPFDAYVIASNGNSIFELGSFTGKFKDNSSGELLAFGRFTGQGGQSYSITVEPVPEPLTILGTGLALGLGGLFKSKQSKKQSLEA